MNPGVHAGIWWDHTYAPGQFQTEIIELLENQHSIRIEDCRNIPWKEYLFLSIQNTLMHSQPDRILEIIPDSVIKDFPDPGRYFLEQYCPPSVKLACRPGTDIACFLGSQEDLPMHCRYFWIPIKNTNTNLLKNLEQFISGYLKACPTTMHAVFILEYPDIPIAASCRGITDIRLKGRIKDYDLYSCTALMASRTQMPEEFKPYMAELAYSLCQKHIELAADLLENPEAFLQMPIKTLKTICRSKPEKYSGLDITKLKQAVWQAQTRQVWPAIENYRLELIQRYKKYLIPMLPIQTANYGKATRLEDLETGLLAHLIYHRKLFVAEKYLDSYRIFQKARNHLAHSETVPYEDLKFILLWKNADPSFSKFGK